ncbi:MAG: cobalamin-dependent protein [Gemmatimonadaceae bacterium]
MVRNVGFDTRELLSTSAVARLCHVSAMTVARWIDAGRLPAVRTPGGWRRVRRADALRFATTVGGRSPAHPTSAARLARRLVSGQRVAVTRWARDWVDGGATVSELVRTALAPAMRLIGDQWAAGTLDILAEHRATAIVAEAIAVARAAAPRVTRRHPRLILACPAGEQHGLAVQMAAQSFIDAGWDADILGADVPTRELVAELERSRPHAVGISVSASTDALPALLAALRRAQWDGLVLLGGALADTVRPREGILVDDGVPDFAARAAARLTPATHAAGSAGR